MNGKKAVYQFVDRPLVRVRLGNPHAPSAPPIDVPALIDTGADTSAVSALLCPLLGHSFENGISKSAVSGVGKGTIRSCTHSTKLTVLFPEESDVEMPQIFEPIEFPCKFIEQDLRFVLLGQRDFLRMFRYDQDGHAGWFSLEQIVEC